MDSAQAALTPQKPSFIPSIQWYEGMLLGPQHFQQNDLRFQQIIGYHVNALAPFYWGIQSLSFDPTVLPDGLLRVLELEAVLPDGLIVSYNNHMTQYSPLEVDLRPVKPHLLNQDILIYLCVPELREQSSSVIGEWPRYFSTETQTILDDNTYDNPIAIPRLLPRLSLIAAEHFPARYVSFPLAKIGYQDEIFVHRPFIPPLLNLKYATELWQNIALIAQRIREKAAYLSERFQNQAGTPMLMETTHLLRPLLQSLPVLEAVIHTPQLHPFHFHLTLCEVLGNLSTLKLSQPLPSLPSYNHNDLFTNFKMILDTLNRLISSIDQNITSIPFIQRDRLFAIKLYEHYLQEDLLVGVRAPAGMTDSDLTDWFMEAIIACDSSVESVRGRRITGASRSLLSQEELYDLMPGRNVLIFKINRDPTFVKAHENLNIFNAGDLPSKRPIEMTLYIRNHLNNDNNQQG